MECLLAERDLEWHIRLTTLPLEEHSIVYHPSDFTSSYNCGSSSEIRDLRSYTSFDENGPVSWWLHTLVILSDKEWAGKNHCVESVNSMLLVAQSELTRWCKGVTGHADSVKQETLTGYDFSYTAPASSTFGEVKQSSLSTLDPDSQLRCMLTDLRKQTVTVRIISGPSSSELKNILPTAESSYHFFRRNMIEREPFLALNIERIPSLERLSLNDPIIFAPDIVERLKTRLADITPLCVVLQQQRAALLCKPETSLFDIIIVLVAPASDGTNRWHVDEDESTSNGEEFWCTGNNGRYLHCSDFNCAFLNEQEHHNILLLHKAFLTVGSGKLVAMMHFASAQGMIPCSFRCSKSRQVTVLKIILDDQEDALRDFKDMIWFMYTGVLRDLPYTAQAADNVEDVYYQDMNDARLLRLLWLADEYLMTNLTYLLEHRMLKALSPSNASAFFTAAKALGLQKLCLAAGICELYSMRTKDDKNGQRTYEMLPAILSVSPEDTFQMGSQPTESKKRDVTLNNDEDDENSIALVLQEILISLAVSSSS